MTLSELMRLFERKTNLNIGIHTAASEFAECPALSLQPDQLLHHGSRCEKAKLDGFIRVCSGFKEKLIARAREGRCFQARCPFGVRNFCVPVLQNGKLAAMIHLDGANPGRTECGKFLADFLRLELELWHADGHVPGKKHGEPYYADRALFFIETRFTENIGLAEAAEELRVTPDHLGQVLLRRTGKSFRTHLTERRIAESKVLLALHREFTVSRIGFLCGFSDGNYFSTVFRKKMGLSPLEYRRRFGRKNPPPEV